MIWTPEKIKWFNRKYQVRSILRPDGMYNVYGTIKLTACETLNTLPPIHTVFGSFICNHSKIVTLEGSPRRISTAFYIYNTLLKSLDGAPIYIGTDFTCNNNPNLQFTKSQLDAMNIQGHKGYDPEQLIIEDPSEYVERGLLPI